MLYNPRMKWLLAAAFLFAACSNASAQDSTESVLKSGAYSSPELGFRYVTPAAMRDITASAKAQIQERAAALHRISALVVLLAMASGPDDTASDWDSMGIQIFPRAAWSDADDYHAESLMNASVARGGLSVGPSQSVTFSNQKFVVTQFELHEGSLTKHATVYTTVRRGKLLSFDFSGNSVEQVNKMAETMKSLSFSGPN
jgi:hypothetical protein